MKEAPTPDHEEERGEHHRGPRAADEKRLAELGYKQELSRDLERLSELRDLVHDHLDPGGLLHDLRPGLEQRRPDRDLLGLAADLDPDPDHRLLHVRAGVGLPDRGRHLLVGVQARRPGWGWFTGWFNLIGLVAVVASVDYGCATFMNTVLGLYERRPRLQRTSATAHFLQRARSCCSLVILAAPRADQHLRAATWSRCFNNDLGLVARRRRRGDPRGPRSSCPTITRASTSSSPSALNNSGFGDGHVLVLRPAARLPADAVHDHRLRRVARTSPRRPTAPRDARPRASGARSSTPRVIGWFLLLAITFAGDGRQAVNDGGGRLDRRCSRAR